MLILLEINFFFGQYARNNSCVPEDGISIYVASSILKLVQPWVKLTFTHDQLMLVISSPIHIYGISLASVSNTPILNYSVPLPSSMVAISARCQIE